MGNKKVVTRKKSVKKRMQILNRMKFSKKKKLLTSKILENDVLQYHQNGNECMSDNTVKGEVSVSASSSPMQIRSQENDLHGENNAVPTHSYICEKENILPSYENIKCEVKTEWSQEDDLHEDNGGVSTSYECETEFTSPEIEIVKNEVLEWSQDDDLHEVYVCKTECASPEQQIVKIEVLKTERSHENNLCEENGSASACSYVYETNCALPKQENFNDHIKDSKRRRSQQVYVGDFTIDDMNCPKKAKLMFEIAKKAIAKKNNQIKCLSNKSSRLQQKVKTMEVLIERLKSQNKY